MSDLKPEPMKEVVINNIPDFAKIVMAMQDGGFYRLAACSNAGCAEGAYRLTMLYNEAFEPRATEQPRHKWDADGERCVKCGDKDWMNDPVCSESKLKEQPQEGMPDASGLKAFERIIEALRTDPFRVDRDDLKAVLKVLSRADTVETVSVAELDVDHGADPQGGVGHYEIGYSAGYNQAINDISAKYPNGVRIVE